MASLGVFWQTGPPSGGATEKKKTTAQKKNITKTVGESQKKKGEERKKGQLASVAKKVVPRRLSNPLLDFSFFSLDGRTREGKADCWCPRRQCRKTKKKRKKTKKKNQQTETTEGHDWTR